MSACLSVSLSPSVCQLIGLSVCLFVSFIYTFSSIFFLIAFHIFPSSSFSTPCPPCPPCHFLLCIKKRQNADSEVNKQKSELLPLQCILEVPLRQIGILVEFLCVCDFFSFLMMLQIKCQNSRHKLEHNPEGPS